MEREAIIKRFAGLSIYHITHRDTSSDKFVVKIDVVKLIKYLQRYTTYCLDHQCISNILNFIFPLYDHTATEKFISYYNMHALKILSELIDSTHPLYRNYVFWYLEFDKLYPNILPSLFF
jgi:hypothetical protein